MAAVSVCDQHRGALSAQIVGLLSATMRQHLHHNRAQCESQPAVALRREWAAIKDLCHRTRIPISLVDEHSSSESSLDDALSGRTNQNEQQMTRRVQQAARRWQAIVEYKVAQCRQWFYRLPDSVGDNNSHDSGSNNAKILVTSEWRQEVIEMLTEIKETVEAMYPGGCGQGELRSTLQTIAAMSGAAVDDDVLSMYDYQSLFLPGNAEQGDDRNQQITCEQLKRFFIQGPLFDKMMPSRWWEDSNEDFSFTTEQGHGDSAASLPTTTEIAVKLEPVPMLKFTTSSVSSSSNAGSSQKKVLKLARFTSDFCSDNDTIQSSGNSSDSDLIPLARRLDAHVGHFPGVTGGQIHGSLVKLRALILEKKQKHTINTTATASSSSSAQQESASAMDLSTSQTRAAAAKKADIGLLYRDATSALKDVDLNDADDATLQEYKDKMTEGFNQVKLKPGDEGYQYDKRADFVQTAKSEWDDSDDD